MKKLTMMAIMAAAALSFQACNNGTHDSVQNADSTNAVKDSSNNPSATGGIAADKDDSEFAVKAADGGMTEVAYAKLALQKSSNPKIKDFAQMMVTDHTKANDELMGIAKTQNITLPNAPSADHQKVINDAAAKSATDFDKQYVNDMVSDHKEDVSLFEKESKDAKDSTLKAFATKTLPTLKMHLESINRIHDSMK